MRTYLFTALWMLGIPALAVGADPGKPVSDRPAEAVRLTRSFYPKFFLNFSPDGSHLTYSRHYANKRSSKAVLMGLRILDVNGTNDRPLLKDFEREVRIQEHAAWSPDGKHLALSGGGDSLGNAVKDVFVCDIVDFSASKLRPLVPGSRRVLAEQPSWSPDGKQLVVKYNASMTLGLIDADGRNRRELTKQSGSYLENPVWSPDGQRIAFASDRDGNCEIYTITPQGTDLTRVTNHPSTDCHPRWSPDGQWIAFTSYRDRNSEIYVVRPDGSGLLNLTRHPGHDDFPAWSPDGRWLAFLSARDGAFDIYRLPVPAGLRVASRPPARPRASLTNASAKRADGLVVYYSFNEGEGAVAHDQAGPNHAILHGAAWMKSKKGAALKFEGKKAYVDCGNRTDLQLKGPLTISVWVKSQGAKHNQYVFAKHGWNVYLGPDDIPRFETRTAADDDWDTLAASIPLPKGRWSSITVVFDSVSQKKELYINGALSRSSPRADGAIGAVDSYNLELGSYGSTHTQNFHGLLDELRIYDKAFPAAEIKKRYDEELKTFE